MRIRHQECRNGIKINETVCPDCKGTGSDKITLGVGEGKGPKCPTCNGKGKLVDKTPCEECVEGYLYFCDFCGNEIEGEDSNICATCEENPIVIQLGQPLDTKYLDGKQALAAKIEKVSERGINVRIGGGYSGYFKPNPNVRYQVGNTVAIRLRSPLTREDRNKSVPVIPLRAKEYKIVQKHLPVYDMAIKELTEKEGNIGKFVGQIIDIYYMRNGPTLFTFVDESGYTIQGGAIHPDGDVAYPNLSKNTVVSVIARFKQINEKDRLQIYKVEKVKGPKVGEFFEQLSKAIYGSDLTYDQLSFFVESSIYDQLREQFVNAAVRIRSAIMKNHNIILRYHSPCVDGATGAYAIDHALLQFYQTRGGSKGDFRRLVRRIPQRNAVLEVREVTRDLSFALDNNPKNLPLYILVDVGSSEASKPALNICKSYGVETIIVDHHFLASGISDLVVSAINPYLIGTTDSVTSGMLATELAKFISPETDMENSILQLAAISGYSDNIAGQEYDKYIELANKNEFDRNWLDNVTSAVDYVLFGLRHFDGSEILRNLFGITGSSELNADLIESITPTSKSLFAKAFHVVKENCTQEDLNDSTILVTLDLDNYAPKFEYPSHQSLLSALHTAKVEENDSKSIVTLGIGGDYVIVHNSKLGFEFSNFLSEIQEEHLELGVTGAGHRSTGSLQFLGGHKEVVLEEIKKQVPKE